ncbi:TIGR00341 family protein [Roseovarius sp. SYSU LYC5161]|uniref:TIGR00341 family protein n=1 Tax=Roseovarius halophilus (ex Wu et al. 2025) TaxID=3376060 RepID=UPI00399C22B3
MYNQVWEQARTDRNYAVFVTLSTVVAAFGMIADNVAVVVGAMVIAPLLGPNLALAVGVALGDGRLMGRAILSSLTGLGLALGLGVVIAQLWPVDATSAELRARAEVGFDGMAIALASGAAAALSLVTGMSSALVGVMVAVALLPPTTAIGLFLGAGHARMALDAALLLAVNVVCVTLAAQVIMVLRGITPRTWFEKRSARRASLINGVIWLGLLVALAALLWLRTPVTG